MVLNFSHGYYHINFILQDTSISPQDSCAYPFFYSFGNQIFYGLLILWYNSKCQSLALTRPKQSIYLPRLGTVLKQSILSGTIQ